MKIVNYLLFAVLGSGLASSAKKIGGKKKVWQSESTDSDWQTLYRCVKEVYDMLEKHPRAPDHDGYFCGDKRFEFGGTTDYDDDWANRDVVKKCEPEMTTAALEGRDWFHCVINGAYYKKAGWSPKDKFMCAWKKPIDHGPCRPEGW